jgi:DNA polymerase I
VIVEQNQTEEGRTLLYLFSRNEKNQRVRQTVELFLPYFYVLESERIEKARFKQILRIDGGFKSISGEPLKKIIVKHPKDVAELRNQFKVAFEADIPFTQRFLIDQIRQITSTKLRIGVFDIENAAEGRLPDPFSPEKEVTAICYFDNYTNQYHQFLWRADLPKTGEKTGGIFTNERDMLDAFFNFVAETDPDVLSGFNIKHYDLPYLINRAKKIGARAEVLSPLRKVFVDGEDITIKGRIIADAYELYKHPYFAQGKHESNRLGDIAERELGMAKIQFEGTYAQLWREDIEALAEYNQRDVEIVWKLLDKYKWIDVLQEIHEVTFCEWRLILASSFVIDALLLKKCKEMKMVLPSRKAREPDESDHFEGGAVRPVIKGAHENVIVLDIESLYPNIVRAFNISYETVDPNGEIKLENGNSFKRQRGLVPNIVDMLYDRRISYKRLLEDKDVMMDAEKSKRIQLKQNCFKILLNAMYGVLGLKSYRLYRKECAESVTFVGRKIIGSICGFVEKEGFKVVASDTDSVIFVAPGNLDFAILTGETISAKINNEFFKEELARYNLGDNVHFFRIKFEAVYDIVVFVRKKLKKVGDEGAKKCRFGLIVYKNGIRLEKPIFEVKGFKSKRSDTAKLGSEVQRTVFLKVLKREPKAAVDEYVGKIIADITDHKFDWETLGTPIGLSKNLNDYETNVMARRACLFSNAYLGTEYGKGSKPKVVYVDSLPDSFPRHMEMQVFDKTLHKRVKNSYPVTCIAFESNSEVPAGAVLNVPKTVQLNVVSKVEAVYDALDWVFPFAQKKVGRGKKVGIPADSPGVQQFL